MGGSPVGERTFVPISLAIIVRPLFEGHDRVLLVGVHGVKRLGVGEGEGVVVVAGSIHLVGIPLPLARCREVMPGLARIAVGARIN